MRDAGFTLAGGGVFARHDGHGDGRGEGGRSGAPSRRLGRIGATADDGLDAPAARCIAVRDGGVDLYA